MIEGAELLELFQWENNTIAETKKDLAKISDIKSELADVLIYCLELSALLGLDAEQIVRDKLVHNSKKYPAQLFKQSHGDNQQTKIAYRAIKREYRRKNNS